PREPAMLCYHFLMHHVHKRPCEPAWFCCHYSASFLSVFRYCLRTCSNASTASWNSGSYGVSSMPRSVSTRKTLSPALTLMRSTIAFGSVALTEPPVFLRVITLVMFLQIQLRQQ